MARGPKQRIFVIIALAVVVIVGIVIAMTAVSTTDYDAPYPAENDLEMDLSAAPDDCFPGALVADKRVRDRDPGVLLG